jgi:hypothetical protein
MPVTPFHMGPAVVVKAAAGRHFSLIAFGLAQAAMDIEPAVGMLRGAEVLHGWTHTYVGATVIGAAVLGVARPLGHAMLRWWNAHLDRSLAWLATREPITWPAAAAGAFVGTFSHVALDSLMQADLQPFAPFASGNPLLHGVGFLALHVACVAAGIVGLALWAMRERLGKRHIAKPAHEDAAN